ncbi:13650_t:CDS:2, partial [Cetraspora pellucida]
QQKRAEVAHFAHVSYSFVDLDSSEKYVDSSSNIDKSSDDNFIKINNLDDANLSIEQHHSSEEEQPLRKKDLNAAMHISVFAFDNATSHKAFSEDALVALKMNFGPDSLALKMQKTV